MLFIKESFISLKNMEIFEFCYVKKFKRLLV
jgi:hypothetical protein